MSNPIYKAMEIASLEHDISERQKIIDRYFSTGWLDRNDVITKICNLRSTDQEILQITTAQLIVSATPFEQCSNEQLVGELKMQKDLLEGKLAKKLNDDSNTTDNQCPG